MSKIERSAKIVVWWEMSASSAATAAACEDCRREGIVRW